MADSTIRSRAPEDDLTLTGRESLEVRASALKASLRAFEEGKPDTADSVRRLARAVEALASRYRLTGLAAAARQTAVATDDVLAGLARELVDCAVAVLGLRHESPWDVLVVEDDADLGTVLKRLVAEAGRQVEVAGDLATARRALSSRNPALVILDLNLPDGDGRDLLLELRSRPSGTRTSVIVLSGEGSPEVRTECFALGADEFLQKPVDPGLFRAAVASRLRRTNELVQELRRDALTGLPTRASTIEIFDHTRQLADRRGLPTTLAMLDIDHFKKVNDTWGHSAGDGALVLLAVTLREVVRRGDHIGRWGGEEFVIVFPETGAQSAGGCLRRVMDVLRRSQLPQPIEENFRLCFSAGVVEARPGESLERVLERADRLMYEAKDAGRGRIEWEAGDGERGTLA